MPEFLKLLPPEEARERLFSHLPEPEPASERIDVAASLGRVTAEDISAPHPLPDFRRSTVDGFAVLAKNTHGASASLPAYLNLVGEVPMGDAPNKGIRSGECMIIHTGGMLPEGADAVVMLEYTQQINRGDRKGRREEKDSRSALSATSAVEVEMSKSVAEGENVIAVGEDVAQGQVVQPKGSLMRPAEIGGLMALGITQLRVVKKVRVGLISSGDEVIPPEQSPRPGEVRDVNSHTLAGLVSQAGGEPVHYGIVEDTFDALKETARKALGDCDVVLITAGSSASTRDLTADVIATLGKPGVLVHGINTRPGKPTILGVCDGKVVIGLPGNPVSALVNGYMLLVPLIEYLQGKIPSPAATIQAKLAVNLPSQSGREDWWPVRLTTETTENTEKIINVAPVGSELSVVNYNAEPIFGKSNLIFTLATADGLLRIPPDATGLSAGEIVKVLLI